MQSSSTVPPLPLPTREGRSKLNEVQSKPPQSDAFVPWFDRQDLPPNRGSKKRTQKRKYNIDIVGMNSTQLTEGPPQPSHSNSRNVNPNSHGESTDKYRTANDHVLNYLKGINQRQLHQQQNLHTYAQPLHNVSVSSIKNQLLFQKLPAPGELPSYRLTPTVNDIITEFEKKRFMSEELTHEQRLQKERLLRLQQQRRPFRVNTTHQPKGVPKLNLPPILESNNVNSNDMTDDGALSPTSSTSSTCSSLDEDRRHEDFALPPISKLHLPPLNLPSNDWDGPRSHDSSRPTPRDYMFDSMNLSPNPSPLSSPRVYSGNRSGNRSGRTPRYSSPRHAPYPSPKPSNRQLSPMDASPQSPENQLGQEQQLFEAVFKHTPCAMAIVSVHGFFVSVNKSFSDLLEFKEEEMRNKNVISVTSRGGDGTMAFMHQILMGAHNSNHRMQQTFYSKSEKAIQTVCSVGMIKDVFGHGSFFVVTIMESSVVQQ